MIINGKKIYDQTNNSDINWYEEIRKLKTGQGQDYTTDYLLAFDYTNNHCGVIAVDLRRHKELDADPKAIQQIECVGQLDN